MKVASKSVVGVMEMAYGQFLLTNNIKATKQVTAAYYVGAALATAAHDGTKENVEHLTQLATDALGKEKT